MDKQAQHLGRIIFDQAEKYGQMAALYSRNDTKAKWEPMSWARLAAEVRSAALWMISIGVKEGDRVGIFTQNMSQHIVFDFACFSIKAISVPIYATSSAMQVNHILKDAAIHTILVGEQEQMDTLDKCDDAKRIIRNIVTATDECGSTLFHSLIRYSSILKKEHPANINEEFERRTSLLNEDDVISIIYTSGTTGKQKGVLYSMSNYTEFLRIHTELLSMIGEDDTSLTFLPLSHIFERAWTYFCLYRGVTLYICHLPSEVERDLTEVHPTVMCAVPRFWEKVYAAICQKVDKYNFFKKSLYKWGISLGKSYNIHYKRLGIHAQKGVSASYKLLARPMFRRLKQRLGIDRGRIFFCAGAKLSDNVNAFVHGLGINLVYGYGLTESTATVCCFPPNGLQYVIGSAGTIIDGLQVRISPDSEILLKGKTITKGYYNNPDANKEAFTPDGWFRTGDCGFIDKKNNILYVTERIKDLFKTAGGKYVAPQLIEGMLTEDGFISQAVAIGNERKYISALIVPNFKELEKWAGSHKLQYDSHEELVTLPEVNEFYQNIIDRRTEKLARYERIKRFTLLSSHFTMEEGHLTSTNKIRRKVINELYAEAIDKMYDV